MIPVNIALLGARLADASRFAACLSRVLRDSGTPAHLKIIGSMTPNVDITRFDVVLLLGLAHRGRDAAVEQADDESLRAFLQRTQTPFLVIYGSDEEKLRQSTGGVQRWVKAGCSTRQTAAQPSPGGSVSAGSSSTPSVNAWVWLCDKCSDPQCERRLLTDLLARRAKASIQA